MLPKRPLVRLIALKARQLLRKVLVPQRPELLQRPHPEPAELQEPLLLWERPPVR